MLNKKKFTQAQFIAYAGVLSALAIVLAFLAVPYPLVPYLNIDLSEVIVLIAAVLNIWLAIIVATTKALLTFLVKPDSNIIGNFSLWLGSLCLIIPYYFASKKMSKIKALVVTTVVFTLLMTFANYVYITPAFYQQTLSEMRAIPPNLVFQTEKMQDAGKAWLDVQVSYLSLILAMYIPFNLLKGTIVSAAFYFVSERLSKE